MILDTRENAFSPVDALYRLISTAGASAKFGTPLFFAFLELSGGEGRAGVDRRRARPALAPGKSLFGLVAPPAPRSLPPFYTVRPCLEWTVGKTSYSNKRKDRISREKRGLGKIRNS